MAALAGAALSGCGNSGDHGPSLAHLPLTPGAHVEVSAKRCNAGQNAYCELQLVVLDARYSTSTRLLTAESRLLRHDRWTRNNAQIGLERADDSPRDRLHVTYATASNELEGIDLGWIKRARPVTLALSRALFAHDSALAVVLELGAG